MVRFVSRAVFLVAVVFLFAVLLVKSKYPELNTMIVGPFGIKASALRDAAGIASCLLLGAASFGIVSPEGLTGESRYGKAPWKDVSATKNLLAQRALPLPSRTAVDAILSAPDLRVYRCPVSARGQERPYSPRVRCRSGWVGLKGDVAQAA